MYPAAPMTGMLVILLLSPLVLVAVHAIASRVLKGQPSQATAFKSSLLGYLPVVWLLWFFIFRKAPDFMDHSADYVYCFIVYSTIAYTYFHFFNMSETARRIRILYEIYSVGSLSSQDITALYKSHDLVNIRLERLLALKQLKLINGFYLIDRKTIYYAAVLISVWRKLLYLDDDEA